MVSINNSQRSNRVTPHAVPSNVSSHGGMVTKYNVTNTSVDFDSEMDGFGMDTKTRNGQVMGKKFHKRPFLVNSILSFKNLIFLLVLTCIVLFCLAYWLTVTFLTSHVAEELTRVILVTILQKVQNLLNDRFTIVKATTITMYRDWKTQHLNFVDGVHKMTISDSERQQNIMYLQSRVANYNMTGIAFHFGENNQLSQFGTLVSYTPTWEIDHFNFFSKELNAPLVNLECKLKSGIVDTTIGNQRNVELSNGTKYDSLDMCNYVVSTNSSTQLSSQLDTLTPTYQIIKSQLLEKRGPSKTMSGLWFEPYYNSIYNTGLYYAVPLYDDAGSYLGYVSTIFNLFKLGGCLKRFRCKTKGFVVLSEFKNNTVLAATVNGKTKDGLGRLNIWDMTDLNSGKVLKKAFEQGMDFYPKEYSDFQLEVDGVFYFVAHQRYKLLDDSMDWRLTIVVNDDNLQTLHYQQLYVSVGITIAFFILGFLGSIAITYIVIRPLRLLQNDFKNIAVMKLENVKSHSSLFAEYHAIYGRLDEMVNWLKDIRSFLPQSVLSQLESTDAKENQDVESSTIESHGSHKHSSSKSISGHQSHVNLQNHTLFATGLQYHKSSVIVTLQICNLMDMDPYDVTNIYEKLIGAFYQLALTQKANLQISELSKLRCIIESKEREESNKKKGMVIALKMHKTLAQINTILENKGHKGLSYHIAISSGSSYSGNVGTRQQRIYGILNRSVENCDEMLIIASKLKIPIIVDHETLNLFASEFAYRPVDRILFSSVSCEKKRDCNVPAFDQTQILYQLFDEMKVEHDEWMYELQGKEKYKHCEHFIERTKILFNKDYAQSINSELLNETLLESARILEESQFEGSDMFGNQQSTNTSEKPTDFRDVVTDRLAKIMTNMANEASITYFTKLDINLHETY